MNRIIHISQNKAKEGQCGTCSHMLIGGYIYGVCEKLQFKECNTIQDCICNEYKKGAPQAE